MHNHTLFLIKDISYHSWFVRLGMPVLDRETRDSFNRELEREREYDRHELDQSVQRNVPLLNHE